MAIQPVFSLSSSRHTKASWALCGDENIAVKREGVEGFCGVGCNHGHLGHRALMCELCLPSERGGDMEIIAATGTNAPPGANHSRDPFQPIVTELLPFVTLPRTYCAKNQRDLPGAGKFAHPDHESHRPFVHLGRGRLFVPSAHIHVHFIRDCSPLVCIVFTFADGECDRQLVSTSTIAVQMEVARKGHRATRDVRRMRKAQSLREALHFRPRRGRRRPEPNTSQE